MDEEKRNEAQPEEITPQQEAGIEPEPVEPISPAAPEERSMGPVLGSIIVVIILVVAAFYVWSTASQDVTSTPTPTPVDETVLSGAKADSSTEALNTQSDSDALADIEADLEATDLEDLDAELADIEAELSNI